MTIFLLDVYGHWMEVFELDGLVRLGVIMLHMVLVLRLSDRGMVILLLYLGGLFVDDARKGGSDGQETNKDL